MGPEALVGVFEDVLGQRRSASQRAKQRKDINLAQITARAYRSYLREEGLAMAWQMSELC